MRRELVVTMNWVGALVEAMVLTALVIALATTNTGLRLSILNVLAGAFSIGAIGALAYEPFRHRTF